MAGIIADVSEDIRKLQQIKAEIASVKQELRSIDIRVRLDLKEDIETRLQSLMKQYNDVVLRIAKVEGEAMLAAKKIDEAINGVSSDPLKSFDEELMKMCSNLNKYFDELLVKMESLSSLLQVGKTGIDNSSSNNVPTQQLEELRSKNTELTEQLRAQKEEIKQQQEEWNKLATAIKTNNVSAIEQYKQATSSSSDAVKSANSELKGLTKDLDENIKYYDKLVVQTSAYNEELAKIKALKDKGATRVVVGDNGISIPINDEIERLKANIDRLRENQKGVSSEIIEQKNREAELNGIIEQGNQKHSRTRTLIMDAREQLIQMRAAGLQNTAQYQQSAEELGKMRKQMVLVNAEMAYLSNPNKNLAMFKAGLSGIASSASLLVGVMGLVNQKNEDMLQLQTKIQSLLGVIVGLEGTYNMVKKSSILMIAIENAKRRASIASQALEAKAKATNITLTWSEVAAQKALNLVAKSNPYLLLAGAILTVVGGIWLLVDANKTNASTQERVNTTLKEQKKHYDDLKSKVNSLISIVKDEASTRFDVVRAYKQLQEIMPGVFKNMDIETIKLMSKLGLLKDINKESNRNEIIEAKTKVVMAQNDVDRIKNYINSAKDAGVEVSISDVNKLKEAQEKLEVAKKVVSELEKIQKDADKLDKIPTIKNKSYWETQKKEAEAALDSIASSQKKLMDAGNFNGINDTVIKSYKDNVKKLNEAEKELKVYDSSSSQESAADKLHQQQEKYKLLMNKQALEQSRAAEDLENQTEQARINAMKEGSTRTLEQMKLDHKKEMQQLDRQQEDLLRKKIEDAKAAFDAGEDKKVAKDSNYKRKIFDGSNISLSQSEKNAFDNQRMYLDLKQSGEMQAYLDKERHSWDEYLLEYSNFQEKKLALKRIYDDKIAKATTAGEKASLKKEFETKDKELNLDEIKSSINFADIFGNLDAQSTDAIKTLRDKLKEIIEKSAKDLKPSDLKALQEALQGMELKIAERDPFSELKNGLDNYKASCKDLETAQSTYNATLEKGWTIVSKYDEKTGKTTYSYISQKQALEGLIDAQRKKKESQMQLTQSINSIGEKGQQVVQAGNDLVDMLTSLGVKIPESVAGALSGVGQIMDGMASIDITKPMSIVTGSVKILAGLGKTIGSIFGLGGDSNTKKHFEDLKEQLDGINKIYEKIIENSKEKITFGEGFAAVTAAADAMDTLNKKLENYRSLVRAGIEYKDGSKKNAGWHSNKNVGADNFARMSELVGKSITSVYDLVNLDAEELYTIMTKLPGAWGAMDEHVRTALEDIVECKDEAKELGDALGEAVTGVSFDSFYNGFIDQLADMEASSEEFADNFEGYLRKSIMASIVANNYKGQIEKLYNDWAKYGNDQIYSEDEIKDLRKQQENITNAMLAERENLANTFGWENSSSSQEATKGSFQTMSQDTGTELNGRFTAFQASNEEIKNQSAIQSQSLNLLTAKADTILSVNTEVKNIADDTRDLIAQTYLELVQISENTGNSAKYLKDIKADIAEVKKNTSKL